jgi:hypothetical protein
VWYNIYVNKRADLYKRRKGIETMKNVNGLANAMRLVESACEKGEITIIGEGATPTPVELYKKCVAYINAQYGVDILNLVLNEQKPCECNGSCTTVIVETDEDEDEPIIDVEGVERYLDEAVAEEMSYLNCDCIDRIAKEILTYCDEINDENEGVDEDILTDNICDIIEDEVSCVDGDVAYEVAKELAHNIYINYVD